MSHYGIWQEDNVRWGWGVGGDKYPVPVAEKPVDVLVGVVIAYYYGKQDFRGL